MSTFLDNTPRHQHWAQLSWRSNLFTGKGYAVSNLQQRWLRQIRPVQRASAGGPGSSIAGIFPRFSTEIGENPFSHILFNIASYVSRSQHRWSHQQSSRLLSALEIKWSESIGTKNYSNQSAVNIQRRCTLKEPFWCFFLGSLNTHWLLRKQLSWTANTSILWSLWI